MSLTVRRVLPETEDQRRTESCRIFTANLALFAESGFKAQPNPGRAMKGVHDCLVDGAVFVAEQDGEIVGSIGLVRDVFWYSDAPLLHERWFYIRPDRRDGSVLQALLAEVAALCDAEGAFAEIKINNPHRRRVPRTRLERVGDALSFQPRGGSYVVAPAPEA